MTGKEIILEQMAACHYKKNWFVPLKDALKGMKAAQAMEGVHGDGHSVWQIVNHILFWNERLLIRFRGEVPPKMEIDNSGTFSGNSGSEEEWENTLRKLYLVMEELETRFRETDNSVLQKEGFKGAGATWFEMFAQLPIHMAYHIGQIVTIRKQQGSWDPAQGVIS